MICVFYEKHYVFAVANIKYILEEGPYYPGVHINPLYLRLG